MNHFLSAIDHLAASALLLPEFPGRPYVLLLVVFSVMLGLTAGLLYWVKSLQITTPAEKLARAEKLVKQGEFSGAKELFFELNAFARASQMAQKEGKLNEAVELALKGKEFGVAAPILSGLGKAEEAAKAFEQAKRPIEAADHWARAGNIDKAIENYRAAGHTKKVIDLLGKADRKPELAQALSEELSRERQNLGSNPPKSRSDYVRQLADSAGEAWIRCGEHSKAYDLFLKAGDMGKAAQCLEEMGQFARASDLYLQSSRPKDAARVLIEAGQYEQAIDLYDEMNLLEEIPAVLRKAGKPDQAKSVEARIALNQGDRLIAAGLFAEAGEYTQAAELYDEDGNYPRAAELWEKGNYFEGAAAAYERAGDMHKAADFYSKSGRHAEAARCYEHAGDLQSAEKEFNAAEQFYDAGRLAEAQGQTDAAISHYQKVGAGLDVSFEASYGLGRLFRKKGLKKLALDQLSSLCRGEAVSKLRIDAFYDFAVLLEESGKLIEACDWYEKLLTIDFHYKDLLVRKRGVEEKIRSVAPAIRTSTVVQGETFVERPFHPAAGLHFADRYQLIEKIGTGGMGVVFLAQDEKLGRNVALKFLSPSLMTDTEKERLFLQEARMTAKLSHPGIVAFYDGGREEGNVFLVMEYVQGDDLKKRVEKEGSLNLQTALSISQQLADAVAYAHSKKIVHRDIKSANILITGGWAVKITDFGLARILSKENLTLTQALGSPLYMAPEQIRGDRYDHRVDLYALGIVLYEILTGQTPFTEGEVAYHHLHTIPKAPSNLRKEIPEVLDQIVLRLLEKSPAKRYATAEELQSDLRLISFSS